MAVHHKFHWTMQQFAVWLVFHQVKLAWITCAENLQKHLQLQLNTLSSLVAVVAPAVVAVLVVWSLEQLQFPLEQHTLSLLVAAVVEEAVVVLSLVVVEVVPHGQAFQQVVAAVAVQLVTFRQPMLEAVVLVVAVAHGVVEQHQVVLEHQVKVTQVAATVVELPRHIQLVVAAVRAVLVEHHLQLA
jgi:hypothetical protein